MTIETTSRPAGGVMVQPVGDALAHLLADTFTLYIKTHGYHWNVTGPEFRALHLMFEEQYVDLQEAVDEIAERIRTTGAPAPGSLRQMSSLTSIVEDEGVPEAMEMVRRLAADEVTLVATARTVVRSAEAAGDVATLDLATRRITIHEKARWMLEATIAR